MDTLEQELKELKGFIADLKADRATQKEKEQREAWTKYTSMSIVFIAVLAAIATQLSGKYSGRTLVELNNATFHQAKASDKWSEYQANSIKKDLYESMHEALPRDPSGNGPDAVRRETDFNAKIDKYSSGKDRTAKEAKDLEDERDRARAMANDSSAHGGGMGFAVSIFQISIALGSICLVTKKKWLWHASLLLAALATVRVLMIWFG